MNANYLEIVDAVDRETGKLKALAALIDRSDIHLSWKSGVADIINDCAEEIERVVNGKNGQ